MINFANTYHNNHSKEHHYFISMASNDFDRKNKLIDYKKINNIIELKIYRIFNENISITNLVS